MRIIAKPSLQQGFIYVQPLAFGNDLGEDSSGVLAAAEPNSCIPLTLIEDQLLLSTDQFTR